MEINTSQAGEIYVIQVAGEVSGADVMPLAQAVQQVLNKRGLNIVLDLERAGAVCAAGLSAVRELAKKLSRAGGALVLAGGQEDTFGNQLENFRSDPDIVFADGRGHGMSLLLNRISVRGELLGFIRQALATTYAAPHAPDSPVACRFVKHLQNFLVYALEPPYDGTLAASMSLRFTMTGCGEDGLKTVSYDGLLYRFATLKDGTPCLVVKVPDLLEVEEDRREDPRIRVNFQCSFFERNQPERKGYGQMFDLSEHGASFSTNNFNYSEGQLIMLEPDFRQFKLNEPIQMVILRIERAGGEVKVGGQFEYVNSADQQRISSLILDTSKW